MEIKFKLKKTRIHTKAQELSDQIYSYFNKELRFPMIMKFIKTKGYSFTYETFNEVRQSDCQDKKKLFLWKIGQTKINFKDEVRPTI